MITALVWFIIAYFTHQSLIGMATGAKGVTPRRPPSSTMRWRTSASRGGCRCRNEFALDAQGPELAHGRGPRHRSDSVRLQRHLLGAGAAAGMCACDPSLRRLCPNTVAPHRSSRTGILAISSQVPVRLNDAALGWWRAM